MVSEENQLTQTALGFQLFRVSYVLRKHGAIYFIWRLMFHAHNSAVRLWRKICYQITGTPVSDDNEYYEWLKQNYPSKKQLRMLASQARNFPMTPLISIITPVYNTNPSYLKACIRSVLAQVYTNWELILVDDASSDPVVIKILNEFSRLDQRIRVVFRANNGNISEASNSALEVAKGAYVALLDHDDLLTPHALWSVVERINKDPSAQIIYSDEDKIDSRNCLSWPYFKPNWSPDFLLGTMYVCHFLVLTNELMKNLGGFRIGYEGSQDWDLILRATELTENIAHIPDILYHWRIHEASNSAGPKWNLIGDLVAEKAIREAIYRRNEPGKVTWASGLRGHFIVRYNIQKDEKVSIIIPFRNIGDIVDKCLSSIFTKSTYENFEIILIDNGSTDHESIDVVDKWQSAHSDRIKVYIRDEPFNHSRLNNFGAEHAAGKYLLFLNSDTLVVSCDWLESMVEQAQRPSIGAVGVKLLYPDQSIQHAGIILGCMGVAGHSHRNLNSSAAGYFGRLQVVTNYSAVTAACLLCRKNLFLSQGKFDESLPFEFNDVDLCLRFMDKGLRNVYLPHVILYHYESLNVASEQSEHRRKSIRIASEIMEKRWGHYLKNDPYYSPHLSRVAEQFNISTHKPIRLWLESRAKH
ncbi:MAG TPA: glycosyltransferase family 2 protein [Oligoflexia bacterium]|nr:glycosyltransferase family 2 protein [Oligoflexia bacterium]HMP49798.1 glycosyltransferase family 2 protein [Oligoflexia bacterium]